MHRLHAHTYILHCHLSLRSTSASVSNQGVKICRGCGALVVSQHQLPLPEGLESIVIGCFGATFLIFKLTYVPKSMTAFVSQWRKQAAFSHQMLEVFCLYLFFFIFFALQLSRCEWNWWDKSSHPPPDETDQSVSTLGLYQTPVHRIPCCVLYRHHLFWKRLLSIGL